MTLTEGEESAKRWSSRAAVLREAGRPPRIEEVEIDAPRGREVLVRVGYAGVCGSDHHVLTGDAAVPLPLVLGHEGAGTVAAVGEAVAAVRPGDPVVLSWTPSCGRCDACASGRPQLCEVARATAYGPGFLPHGEPRIWDAAGEPLGALLAVGCFAEYALVDESAAIPLRTELPARHAALLGCAVMTGVGAVVNTARVRPGAVVLVTGCGGVGLAVVQGARLAGARRVIVADLSAERLRRALALGADDAIEVGSDTDIAATVAALTGGTGVDYAFEAVGRSELVEACVDALRPGGTAVVVGLSPDGSRAGFDAAALCTDEKVIRGSNYGSARPSVDIPRLAELAAGGRLDLEAMVTDVRPLADAADALAAVTEGVGARRLLDCAAVAG